MCVVACRRFWGCLYHYGWVAVTLLSKNAEQYGVTVMTGKHPCCNYCCHVVLSSREKADPHLSRLTYNSSEVKKLTPFRDYSLLSQFLLWNVSIVTIITGSDIAPPRAAAFYLPSKVSLVGLAHLE